MQQQQQQQQPPTQPHSTLVPQLPPTNITTEQIQKYLDENKQLILAILDNQNLGKLSECAQYQAQLQRNLLYLAAIADAQPQTPAVRAQMLPHAAMQQGGHYMPQPSIFPPKATSIPFTAPPQHMPEQHHQFHPQPQLLGGHMAVRPGGFNNGMHMVAHGEAAAATLGGAGSRSGPPPPPSESEFPPRVGPPSSSLDGRRSRQDVTATSESNAAPADDGHRGGGGPAGEHGGGVVEAPSMKRPPEGKTL